MNDLPPTRRAWRYAPPRMSLLLSRAAQGLMRRQGFAETHIPRYWREIVGPDLATLSTPLSLSFPRQQAGKEANTGSAGHTSPRTQGGTLTIGTDSAAATEIRHLEPVIVDRINTYYGYRAVTRLRLSPARMLPAPVPRQRPQRALMPEDHARLATAVAPLRHDGIREALLRLGERILSAQSTGKKA